MQGLGCVILAAVLVALCLIPVVMVDVMQTALSRLHLDPSLASLAVIGIFVGSLFNLPVYRIERPDVQVFEPLSVFGWRGQVSQWRRLSHDTIVAVNVGGCLIPSLIAIHQVRYALGESSNIGLAMLGVSLVNIGVCYGVARPMRGVGIAMPGWVSPAVAVGMTWLVLGFNADPAVRAPVAFVAGVVGPLVGADLLHLKDITRVSAGMLSIGGAGTFDGIVLSSFAAALFV